MLIHPERGDRLELLHRPGSRPGLRPADPPEAVLTEGFGHVAFDVHATRRRRTTGWSRSARGR